MKAWTLKFWTPDQPAPEDGRTFGCAVHGWASVGTWKGPEDSATVRFPRELHGLVFAGKYDDVASQAIAAARGQRPSAAIALFARGDGMEAFLARLHDGLGSVPVTGGGAARRAGALHGAVLPVAEDVALLLLTQGKFEIISANLHLRKANAVEFQHEGSRRLIALRFQGETDWHPAAAFYRELQKDASVGACDCESLAMSDTRGRNLHAAFEGETLVTGSDLPEGPLLHFGRTNSGAVLEGMETFCSDPSSLVFTCAGLRGLLSGPVRTGAGTVAGFMFGEVVCDAQGPSFGNLMLSKLVVRT